MLRKIEHDAVPRFIDAFSEGNGPEFRLYLAQEYVHGRPLDAVVKSAPFSVMSAMRLTRALLSIARYLHGLVPPLIHRDIKPNNIIVRDNGDFALVDFGIAREVTAGGTHNATASGSMGYAPPEQYGGSASERSDLYAIGATVVFALTGIDSHNLWVYGDVPDLSHSLSAPRPFRRFLEDLLQPKAADRPASAVEALDSFDRKVFR